MSRDRKVFLYNGPGSGPLSTADIKEMLYLERLVQRGNIVETPNFQHDYSQLPAGSIFSIGGGHANKIQVSLTVDGFNSIKAQLNQGHHYLGICAGAAVCFEKAGHMIPPSFLPPDDLSRPLLTLGQFDGYYTPCLYEPQSGAFETHIDPKSRLMTFPTMLSSFPFPYDDPNIAYGLYISGIGFSTSKFTEHYYRDATTLSKKGYAGEALDPIGLGASALKESENHSNTLIFGTHPETCYPTSQLRQAVLEGAGIFTPMIESRREKLLHDDNLEKMRASNSGLFARAFKTRLESPAGSSPACTLE